MNIHGGKMDSVLNENLVKNHKEPTWHERLWWHLALFGAVCVVFLVGMYYTLNTSDNARIDMQKFVLLVATGWLSVYATAYGLSDLISPAKHYRFFRVYVPENLVVFSIDKVLYFSGKGESMSMWRWIKLLRGAYGREVLEPKVSNICFSIFANCDYVPGMSVSTPFTIIYKGERFTLDHVRFCDLEKHITGRIDSSKIRSEFFVMQNINSSFGQLYAINLSMSPSFNDTTCPLVENIKTEGGGFETLSSFYVDEIKNWLTAIVQENGINPESVCIK